MLIINIFLITFPRLSILRISPMLGLEFLDNDTALFLALNTDYNYFVVFASYTVAWIGAYAGLSTIPSMHNAESVAAKRFWHFSGSLAMGCEIWSMHFIGMLALSLPVRSSSFCTHRVICCAGNRG